MKQLRLTEQFYPKAETENLLLGVRSSAQSAQVFSVDSFLQSPSKPSDKTLRRQAGQIVLPQAGQIVVEYVLMLLVAISIAVLLINLIVSRREGEEGFLIKAWTGIIKTISDDKTDEVVPENPGEAPQGPNP